MKFVKSDQKFVLRFDEGESLVEVLNEFLKKHYINSGWVQALGAAAWVELAFYDLPTKQYKTRRFDQSLEIVNLIGNVAWFQAAPMLHLHGVFSDENFQTVGGHLQELEVASTCEVLVVPLQGLNKVYDDETGLKLLDLNQ